MIKEYDLVIVGAGVSGTALLYMCSQYTNIKRIAIIEKYEAPARVASNPLQNSQTLHCGDIETNYTLEKALKVKRAASMVRNYALKHNDNYPIIFKHPKMVIGVGKKECDFLYTRYNVFKEHYPDLQFLNAIDIYSVEPAVVQGRNEKIVALASTDEYTTVNFEELARSFILEAYNVIAEDDERDIDFHFGESVNTVTPLDDGKHLIETDDGIYHTHNIVACAGGHSLQLAHSMGQAQRYSILPVAGSYFYTPEILNGKVYTVQNDALPFAAVHGDPDLARPDTTRFGPTAIILPMLERRNWKTVKDFFKVLGCDGSMLVLLKDLFSNSDIRKYMLKNILFEIPFIRRWVFLRDARKIIPSLKFSDLKFAKNVGGIRPQVVDKDVPKLMLGEAKFLRDDGCIFNVTPSPGGTSCLENAEKDMRQVAEWLNADVDEERLQKELFDNTEK